MAEAVAFYAFGGLAVVAALFMITRRNPVGSAWSLVVVLVSLAALFVLLSATFVAAMQVIVYTGAIMVLFLFVIMLLNLSAEDLGKHKVTGLKILGGIVAFGLLVELMVVTFLADMPMKEGLPEGFGQIGPVAKQLFSVYLLPFEVTSVLLLAAIIGAVVLAQQKEKKK